eukprot:30913-Pelagococcus_subviridis.AAC.4
MNAAAATTGSSISPPIVTGGNARTRRVIDAGSTAERTPPATRNAAPATAKTMRNGIDKIPPTTSLLLRNGTGRVVVVVVVARRRRRGPDGGGGGGGGGGAETPSASFTAASRSNPCAASRARHASRSDSPDMDDSVAIISSSDIPGEVIRAGRRARWTPYARGGVRRAISASGRCRAVPSRYP